MKKVLHVAVSMNPSPGVVKQMEWEQQAALELGIEWVCSLHTDSSTCSNIIHNWHNLSKHRLIRYFQLRTNFYKWLISNEKNYDVILLRFSVHDPWQKNLTKAIGHKLFTVHHTKEECELLCQKSRPSIGLMLEKIWGRKTLVNSFGHIGVTPEILEYELSRQNFIKKPSFVFPNSVVTSLKTCLDNRTGDVPEIVFIASDFSEWQGLDKLIDVALTENTPCTIHLIGKISAKDLQRCKNDRRFVIHGLLKQEDIAEIMNIAWCGLSSLALERKGMLQACTLKVREYLQAGIPVYSGHDDSGLPNDFPYYLKGNVNLEEITLFARRMRLVKRDIISAASSKFISKKTHLQKLYDYLNSMDLSSIIK
jgi:hypothetical protein